MPGWKIFSDRRLQASTHAARDGETTDHAGLDCVEPGLLQRLLCRGGEERRPGGAGAENGLYTTYALFEALSVADMVGPSRRAPVHAEAMRYYCEHGRLP